ncbi:hypothetical protein ACFUTR_23355 [Streptomyces sp. NPDC057367]|uniref:hypothetical protein n=1 Tax=Streptomyces sp. NPDC057367 TaxID=3346108 RepID=UPI003630C64D
MSETVHQLTNQQVADLRRQFRERDAEGLGALLRGEPVPPLPDCPTCGAAPERVDQRVEDPEFGVDETALLVRWRPCGHQLRAVVDLDVGPVRPASSEETTT